MNYVFENLIDSKTGEPLIIKDVTPEMVEEAKIWEEKGKEAAERMRAFFSKD